MAQFRDDEFDVDYLTNDFGRGRNLLPLADFELPSSPHLPVEDMQGALPIRTTMRPLSGSEPPPFIQTVIGMRQHLLGLHNQPDIYGEVPQLDNAKLRLWRASYQLRDNTVSCGVNDKLKLKILVLSVIIIIL